MWRKNQGTDIFIKMYFRKFLHFLSLLIQICLSILQGDFDDFSIYNWVFNQFEIKKHFYCSVFYNGVYYPGVFWVFFRLWRLTHLQVTLSLSLSLSISDRYCFNKHSGSVGDRHICKQGRRQALFYAGCRQKQF